MQRKKEEVLWVQVLNCNSYDVATHAAIELQADKFICVLDGLWDMKLGQWLPLTDAEELINSRAAEACAPPSLPAASAWDKLSVFLCTYSSPAMVASPKMCHTDASSERAAADLGAGGPLKHM